VFQSFYLRLRLLAGRSGQLWIPRSAAFRPTCGSTRAGPCTLRATRTRGSSRRRVTAWRAVCRRWPTRSPWPRRA